MAHYAFLDGSNIVTEVITGKNEGRVEQAQQAQVPQEFSQPKVDPKAKSWQENRSKH